MNQEEKKLLNDSLSKLFKIDPEKLASLYNDAGDLTDFSVILDADKERVAKYKTDSDNQYKRGIKEGAEKIEKAVKEKYELESELTGVDLMDHLIVNKIEEAKSSGSKDITKHADYIRLQVEHDKYIKKLNKEWEDKIIAKETEFASARLFEKVRDKALVALASRNPILPTDPRKAQTWKDTYLNELRQAKYQESEDGSITVLDKDGKALQNAHGHIITFDDYEREIAEKYFEYTKAEDRSSPGNKDENGTKTGSMPKTEAEYMERLKNPVITPKERIELVNYWSNNQKK
ncbi:MAG: hypothetical protein ABFC18_03125 [Rikenellaceae bacterium]